MVSPAVAANVPELVSSGYVTPWRPQTAGGCTVFLDTHPGLLSFQKKIISIRLKIIKGTYQSSGYPNIFLTKYQLSIGM